MALPDEHDVIRRAQKGDRTAFAKLVEHYWDRLYRWLYHLSHDRHTAEDLTQETFLKALNGLASFKAGTNLQAWLFRIAHNSFLNLRAATARCGNPFRKICPAPARGLWKRPLAGKHCST